MLLMEFVITPRVWSLHFSNLALFTLDMVTISVTAGVCIGRLSLNLQLWSIFKGIQVVRHQCHLSRILIHDVDWLVSTFSQHILFSFDLPTYAFKNHFSHELL